MKRAKALNAAEAANLSLSDGPSPSGLSRKSRQGGDFAAQTENRSLNESTSCRGRKRCLNHNFSGKGGGIARAKVRSSPAVAVARLIDDDTDAGSKEVDALVVG